MAKGVIHPKLGVTEGHLRAQIRSALRKVWRNSSRRVYIQSVRIPYNGPLKFRWAVVCEICGKVMGQSEKKYGLKKDGTRTKHRKLVYEVDHLGDGNHQFLDIEEDLGKYAKTLLYGDLRILCRDCHGSRTTKQSAIRNNKKPKKRQVKKNTKCRTKK